MSAEPKTIATFDNAYRMAARLSEATNRNHAVARTNDARRPFIAIEDDGGRADVIARLVAAG